MTKIELMKICELEEAARFISKINNNEESHIGYCGKEFHEIVHSLKEDLTDLSYTQSFLTVHDGELVGVLGFDADIEGNRAEVWGPFLVEEKWDLAHQLWERMINILPPSISTLHMFPDKKNSKVIQLAQDLSFQKHNDQTILEITPNDLIELKEEFSLEELSGEHYSEMQQLHDAAFPNTYYSGHQITSRLNGNRKVFTTSRDGKLTGYIYAEAEPDYGEASIEFFAVRDCERGKGLGSKLLAGAIKWIFTKETITSITLCVSSSNRHAINLYKKVGFNEVHELCYFTRMVPGL